MTDAARRFTLLYDQYQPRVLAYALSRASRQVAEEVASATFLVAWERIEDLPSPALPWLLGVARNLLRKHYAQAGQQEVTVAVLAALASSGHAEGDVAEAVVERAVMLHALACLPAQDQDTLTLVAWHGLSSREAAAVIGCSRAAFFVRLHRARRRLERAVADAAGGTPGPPRLAAARTGEASTHATISWTAKPGHDPTPVAARKER